PGAAARGRDEESGERMEVPRRGRCLLRPLHAEKGMGRSVMRSPSLQQLSPSPNFIEDSSYAPHIDARQRVRQHNRQRRRKAKEDDERRAVEEKERQERVQKSVPQVE
ncbi:unnamed protein product, partial [Polarella glacialis]